MSSENNNVDTISKIHTKRVLPILSYDVKVAIPVPSNTISDPALVIVAVRSEALYVVSFKVL